jgi:hypothetical protein
MNSFTFDSIVGKNEGNDRRSALTSFHSINRGLAIAIRPIGAPKSS